MIGWFAGVQIVLALAAALVCLVAFARRMPPNDVTLGGVLLVELLLIGQMVVAIVAPLAGNPPTGDLVEFWLYLIVAAALPVAAGVWSLIERSRAAQPVLAVALVAVAVMLGRMLVIWG